MSQISQLHALVHSLSQAEKRFLQLHHGGLLDGDRQIAQLYKALSEISPDTETLLDEVPGIQSFSGNLPTLITRLRKTLMDLLRMQHGGKTTISKLNLALEEIEILYGKKLWEQATWAIRKAQRSARKHSHLHHFVQFLEWERKLVLARFPKDSKEQIEKIRKQEKDAWEQLKIKSNLAHLEYLARDLMRKGLYSVKPEKLAKFQSLNADSDVERGLESADFPTFTYASNIRGIYQLALQDYEQARETYTRLFNAWRAQPGWIKEQTQKFISIFTNFQITLLHTTGGVPVLEDALAFIKTLKIHDAPTQLLLENTFFQSSLIIYMNTGRFQEGAQLANEISLWIDQNQANLSANVQLAFLYNTAILYFMRSQFRDALRIVYQILDHPAKTARTEIREFTRLFQGVLLYELEEHELNENQLPSTYQYFNRKGITVFQRITISLLQGLLSFPDATEKGNLLRDYARKVENLKTKPQPTGLMELLIWARSRANESSLESEFQILAEANTP